MTIRKKLILSILACAFPSSLLLACPTIDGYVDYNCDGQIRIAITGDSIVKGVGDERELGGYPGRLENKLNVIVENIGVPGASARQLLRDYKRNIDRGKRTTRKTKNLDYLFIEVGTNDYWDYRNRDTAIGLTPRNIRRLKDYLETKLAEKWNVAPLVVVSTLPPVRRDYQQPFINSVNKLIRKQRRKLNLKVFFDRLPQNIIGEDNLHPNAKGYQQMAKVVKRTYKKTVQKNALRTRHDLDQDGLYDEVEELLFETSPELADTDSDTIGDGDEVFEYETDPTLSDTDGDGYPDNEELENGSDPSDPEDPVSEEEEGD